MESNPAIPFVVSLGDADCPADVIDALAMGRFAAGIEPAARTLQLNRVRADAPLLPVGVKPALTAESVGRRALLARGERWTLRVERWTDTAVLTVTATTDELAQQILDAASVGAIEPAGDEDKVVSVGFWYQHRGGMASRQQREIAIEPWESIRRNYSAMTGAALEATMALEPVEIGGRLILLHGPPGTGKTTALRALAHAWRSWCRLEVVLDPEQLLANPGYLMNFVLAEHDDGDRQKWRLAVLEDCDELIRTDAKKGAGQSLARLLNLTDGMAGQGLSVLIALTSNEPIHQLHPAVVRPGRCLAEIEVPPLNRLEAQRWLGRADGIGPDGATLAELFVRRGQLHKLESRGLAAASGQYL